MFMAIEDAIEFLKVLKNLYYIKKEDMEEKFQ